MWCESVNERQNWFQRKQIWISNLRKHASEYKTDRFIREQHGLENKKKY